MTTFTKKIGMSKFWNAKTDARNLKPNEERTLCIVIGNATGVKVGTSQYGDFTGVTGLFEFTNTATGEVTASTTAYVPDVLLGYIQPSLGETRQFAVEIYAKQDSNSPVGFSYTFKPLIEAQDPLLEMRTQLNAIEAPKKASK